MSVMNRIQELLDSGVVQECEYLRLYCTLLTENQVLNNHLHTTQIHHIIPRCYYKHKNIEVDNSSDNLVTLLHKDHVIAHLYLALSSVENWFYLANAAAVRNVLNNVSYKKLKNYLDDRAFFLQLEEYQKTQTEWYEYWSKQMLGNKIGVARPKTLEELNKISRANSNRIYINKESSVKAVKPHELNEYLEAGWIVGNPNASSWRRNYEHHTWIHKDGESTKIKDSELEHMLECGWELGRIVTPRVKEGQETQARKLQGRISIHKGTQEKRITEDELPNYLEDGWIRGGKSRPEFSIRNKENIGKKSRGRIHITNGYVAKFVLEEELESYLENGFWKGRLRKD